MKGLGQGKGGLSAVDKFGAGILRYRAEVRIFQKFSYMSLHDDPRP